MYAISTSEYSPRAFSEGIFVDENRVADICNECSDVIVNAQNVAFKSPLQRPQSSTSPLRPFLYGFMLSGYSHALRAVSRLYKCKDNSA